MTQFTDDLRNFIKERNFLEAREIFGGKILEEEEIKVVKVLFKEALEKRDIREIAAFNAAGKEVFNILIRSIIAPSDLLERELDTKIKKISDINFANEWEEKVKTFCDDDNEESRQKICDSIPEAMQWEFFNGIEDYLAQQDIKNDVECDLLDSPDVHKFKFILSYGSLKAAQEEFENSDQLTLTHLILNDRGCEGFANAVRSNKPKIVDLVLAKVDQKDGLSIIKQSLSGISEAFRGQDDELKHIIETMFKFLDDDLVIDFINDSQLEEVWQNMAVLNQLGSLEFILNKMKEYDRLELIDTIDGNIRDTLPEDDAFLEAWDELKNSLEESQSDITEEDFEEQELESNLGKRSLSSKGSVPNSSTNPKGKKRVKSDEQKAY
jgi:hypothetical protein